MPHRRQAQALRQRQTRLLQALDLDPLVLLRTLRQRQAPLLRQRQAPLLRTLRQRQAPSQRHSLLHLHCPALALVHSDNVEAASTASAGRRGIPTS